MRPFSSSISAFKRGFSSRASAWRCWAADNYVQAKDFSFSAAFELLPCDKDGDLASSGGDWTYPTTNEAETKLETQEM